MVLLKTLLILLLVYYLFKMVIRMLAPKLFSYAAKKTEEHFKENFEQFTNKNKAPETKVGDTTVDKNSTRKSNTSKKVGDYIDFEEID
ncbi:MAG: DUF4834 domain-containing protein [Flavobacteriaceae bacterium]|nr:MAG: DUF4834 domain-containing protein [Flavobacteriaceae bacterium]